ncbi:MULTISPECIES: phosphoribosyl-ATP pyrophosphatase [Bacillaceae]|jgi:hypothetical protein|uniref:Phosphoribosyl-ATP pyrophosphatase n=1 Tax=Ectobacillus funiculus TaxID=137993 RepID=A0ABV5WB67_9BACI|nr:phosphoribosyl-ATP pyrophosphatase [Ectobacillus funiculus]
MINVKQFAVGLILLISAILIYFLKERIRKLFDEKTYI